LKGFRTTSPRSGSSFFLSLPFRGFGCGKAMSCDDSWQDDSRGIDQEGRFPHTFWMPGRRFFLLNGR
jgi:hypothetical protein